MSVLTKTYALPVEPPILGIGKALAVLNLSLMLLHLALSYTATDFMSGIEFMARY